MIRWQDWKNKSTKIGTLLQNVREAAINIEPEAEVILYGSRARGDAASSSDWDFLI